jgi:hypothetical protein
MLEAERREAGEWKMERQRRSGTGMRYTKDTGQFTEVPCGFLHTSIQARNREGKDMIERP